jgi:hypothetical protein
MRRAIFFVFVAGSCVARVLVACGDGASGTDGGQDATADASSSDGAGDAGVASDAASCVDSSLGCVLCCAVTYPEAGAYLLATNRDCACVTPGACNTSQLCGGSGDLCTGGSASAACLQCTHDPDAGDCFRAATNACSALPSCAPILACVASCDAG